MDFFTSIYQYIVDNAGVIVTRLLLASVVLLAFYMLARVLSSAAKRAVRKAHRGALLADMLGMAAKFTVLGFGVIMALDQLGLDITTVLAGAGVLGLAIGFGAQTIVKDIISGFFIILTGVLEKGDYVEVGDAEGKVEEVTLRVTQIRANNGELWYVPNGQVNVVVNHSRDWKRVAVSVGVAYEADLARAIQVLQKIGDDWAQEHEGHVLDAPKAQGVMALNGSDVGLRLVVKTDYSPPTLFAVERELRKQIKEIFDAEGIEIPFPRQVVYHRTEEDVAPPHFLTTEGGPSAHQGGMSQ